jgi:hypothetical protein
VNIKTRVLRRIVREERIATFLKRHGISRRQIAEHFIEESYGYEHEWTEEELSQYTDDDNLSFQIKSIK